MTMEPERFRERLGVGRVGRWPCRLLLGDREVLGRQGKCKEEGRTLSLENEGVLY